ncbi:hypothetical protein EK21DRAFT_115697 [Setomelanomma holmii]|uniref:Uncharacterized protein n=1 Tax=Setomelanomma holmii TaxID=210430 RepID=A0A9P4H1B0_9PLEO|nr:hypothetical protein EK21DRAFT_115697 [Setomelanomma holmii]
MARRYQKPDKFGERLSATSHGDDSYPRRLTLYLQPTDESDLKNRFGDPYKFKAARSQNSSVASCIRAAMRELNKHPEHFVLMSNVNLRVTPSTKRAPIWPPNARDDNKVKLYTFFQDEHEFPATASIAINPRQGPLTADKIVVWEAGKWSPLKEWLVKFVSSDPAILSKRSATSINYFFNECSGGTFNLMCLPLELHFKIYEHVIAPSEEVFPIFISVADSKIGAAHRFNVLGHIPLCFTILGWLKFFGVQVEPILFRDSSAALGQYLSNLKNHCDLEISFRDPEDGYVGHPWSVARRQTTCHNVMIEWIMTFVFEHIQHIRNIKLTSYVKKPQAEKWLSMLAEHRKGRDYNFDYVSAFQVIIATPVEKL